MTQEITPLNRVLNQLQELSANHIPQECTMSRETRSFMAIMLTKASLDMQENYNLPSIITGLEHIIFMINKDIK